MKTKPKPYFLQTSEWSQFWLESSQKQHFIHYISYETDGITLSAYCYEYPWHLGKSFLYIPKGPIFQIKGDFSKKKLAQAYKSFLAKIVALAKQNKSVFIKIDFDYNFTNLIDIDSNENLLKFTKSVTDQSVQISKKTLQYLSTMILDCSNLQKNEDQFKFVESNKDFWSQTNENIRRYTRKSLKQNWIIDTSKTTQNFDDFWQVYQSTAQRQGFAIHPKTYFQSMFAKEFVRIIVLKDETGLPHCCWFGILLDSTLYYLYGGNDDYSFSHHGQYLAHLIALQSAANEEAKNYDLGGYDSEKGFGKFKEGYRGKIVKFLGPLDIILEPLIYTTLNKFINILKAFK
jgi:lipid II:glycine glycyltransferase (peptidoglycan interpeptide bridge formation enzyme)